MPDAPDKIFSQFKEHSVAEFFKKNRQMLGFSGKVRSLTTIVHELVTNSLDACEEAGILPDIKVQVKELGDDHYTIRVEDNGPGIPKTHIGKALGQMLAGTKFHRYVQQRGQQGIGACMSGDTLVPLYDGRILPIKEIVEENMIGERISTLDPKDLRLCDSEITKCWKVKNPKFIRLKTQRGRTIRLTPENPILTVKNGNVVWIPAEELKEGMRIAAPRKLPVSPTKIRTIDLFDFRDIQVDEPELMKRLEQKLIEKYQSIRNAARNLNIHKDVLRNWFRRKMGNGKARGRPTLFLLLKVAKATGFDKEEILYQITRIGRNGTYVNIPNFIDEETAWLAGLIAGDGNLTSEKADKWGVGIYLAGNDINIINKFTSLMTKKFGLKVRVYYDETKHYYNAQTSSSLLAGIIQKFGVLRGNKSRTFDLSNFLFSLENRILSAYLKGIFDAEGSVSVDKRSISFGISNKKALEKIFYALLRLGIHAGINKASDENRILITDKENIRIFMEKIGFTSHEKVDKTLEILGTTGVSSVTEVIPEIAELAKQYVYGAHMPLTVLPPASYSALMKKEGISRYALRQLIEKVGIENETGEYLSSLAESDVIWLKVIELSEEKNDEEYVYDLEVKDCHNFIANGLITHNSGCTMYSLLTTGQHPHATSYYRDKKISCEISIDFKTNRADLINLTEEPNSEGKNGLVYEAEFKDVRYEKSNYGVYEYLRRTALANPHAQLSLAEPNGESMTFPRSINANPKRPLEVQPHPLGITAHDLLDLAQAQKENRKVSAFLQNSLARVSANKVNELRELVKDVDFDKKPENITWEEAEHIVKGFGQVKWIAPETNSIVPIGKEQVEKSFMNIFNPEVLAVTERAPKVYQGGVPFMVEAAIAFGGGVAQAGKKGEIMRFANRVPLPFDAGGCAITEAVKSIDWGRYGLKQFEEEPIVVLVNLVSVHVPYTGAGKQAVSQEQDVIDEIKNAVMEAARNVQKYISGKRRVHEIATKRKLIEGYSEQLASDLTDLAGLKNKKDILDRLRRIIDEKYMNSEEEEEVENKEKGEKTEKDEDNEDE